jgi:hypothetical protein
VSLHVFGIRHHGPGCARSLHAALEQLEPDIVLVEGPPDAQGVLPLLAHQDMKPPVALLIYVPDKPKHAVYYPFTTFSPEWQALNYALSHDIPGRFIDLPQAIQLAKIAEDESEKPQSTEIPATIDETAAPEISEAAVAPPATEAPSEDSHAMSLQDDPLALLAQAAGYTDHELWWERQIEQRHNATGLFESILEAMSELRANTAPKDEQEAQREAHMRQMIRAAQKEGYQRIAVMCGAWHAPVLINPGPAKTDTEILKGLKRVKTEATWIPWTNSRLSYRSGYGAGVNSPGWYEHLWTVPGKVTTRWITRAAHLLREQGLDASSASVIEAVRLSYSLAALRDLPMPGLEECHESIKTVLCNGNAEPMSLIRDKLEIGETLGQVPAETPMVPLQRDLEIRQRQLSLKPSAEIKKLELDLRNENDRARSQLLHQLRLLGIEWGTPQRVHGKKGTFHEHWQIRWQVEFAVPLIEANVWGNTVESAATAFACRTADKIEELPPLTELLGKTILAELSGAIDHLLQAIQKRAAVSADVQHLMDALPPLAQVARYGDVRQTKAEHILPVIDGLFERIIIGLPGACASLDDDAARSMISSIDKVQESISLLNREEQCQAWQRTLRTLIERESIHGLLRGGSCRLLLEQNVLDEDELQTLTGLALSTANPAVQAAAWIEGVLRGSGLLVLHQDGLWRALDRWMSELDIEAFDTLLPILRRAFSGFQTPERRKMGEKVKHLYAPQSRAAGNRYSTHIDDSLLINQQRGKHVLPVLAQIMGVTYNGN